MPNIGRSRSSYKDFNALAQQHLREKLKTRSGLLRPTQDNVDKLYKRFEPLTKYQNDPNKFCRDVLKVKLWSKQEQILDDLNQPPHRVLCAASHAVGKSFLSACYVLFTFFCFPNSITITTAPTQRQVEDVLWRQVRDLNNIAPELFRGQHKARMEINKNWYAMGFTPSTGDALQGLHPKSGTMTIIFDEAVGIPKEIWEACNGLDNDDVRWLCIFNPTKTGCQAYSEWQSSYWKKIRISGLEHPNIASELAGNGPIFPGAIRLQHFDEFFTKESKLVQGDRQITDVEWPPGSGIYRRPSTIAQSRCLGLFPITALDTVWNGESIEYALNHEQPFDEAGAVEIGVDVARGGEDYSVIAVRKGRTCVDLQRRNGFTTTELAEEVEKIALQWAEEFDIPVRGIPIKIDVTGIGWGAFDILYDAGYNVIDIDFGSSALEKDKYPNKRCEIHFSVADLGMEGKIDLTRIEDEYKNFIRQQALGVEFSYDAKSRRVLESKKNTRKRLKMSPDDLDAIALAYYSDVDLITVSNEDDEVESVFD